MAALVTLLLALLVLQYRPKTGEQTHMAAAERQEYLHREMTRLLQEMEQSRGVEESTLRSVLKDWCFWLLEGAFLVVCTLVLDRWLHLHNCAEQDSSDREENEEEGEEDEDDDEGEEDEYDEEDEDSDDEEDEEDLSGTHNSVISLPASIPSPMQALLDRCKVLQELVMDLLGVCQMLSAITSMPQMHPALSTDGTHEAWSIDESSIVYRLLVLLQPPAGHSFSLEQDTTGQLPASRSSIRVLLECLCSKEQLLGETLCALHHHNRPLGDQSTDLLYTLCTGSCLDVHKVAMWAQRLVPSAWLLLPQSQHCQLTVLPSSQCCTFQLTGTFQTNICTEIRFAVQTGSSGPFLSLVKADNSFPSST